MAQYGLIADIGGTNARFALAPLLSFDPAEGPQLAEQDLVAVAALNGAEYDTIADAIRAYLTGPAADYERPEHAVMAIACPTDKDRITMTNHTWSFSVQELQSDIGLTSLKFINDYNALANAIPHLGSDGVVKVGPGEAVPGWPMAVTGPGTGLGLAGLAFSSAGPVTLETEGGHAHFAPTDAVEIDILKFLLTKYERVSVERLLSGMGLENIYQALCDRQEVAPQSLKAADISQRALDRADPQCEEALARFCAILGSYAGDAALMLGAKGGLYIAGGIVPRFLDYFQSSQFRARFEAKARLRGFVEHVPTYVVVSKQPGLLGAAAVLNHRLNTH
ncbi:glucokinase [Saccharospirillum sp. MSK14-1]|uniref:glucokinase n=1 Tax=Saccharospirillum sp. MSK14-1 TaxID=1897632 RepID=UPI000D39E4AD|nr:glucokinase [Saccharospirillum sp. MSK14-1]PTY36017.1 glucokinase [Saccharospirillum sp. MSK14-1]